MTNSTESLLVLAWTTWVAVHKLKLATKHVRRLVQAEAASLRANYAVNYKKHGETGQDFSMCRRRSDPAAQICEVSCAVHERMGDAKE